MQKELLWEQPHSELMISRHDGQLLVVLLVVLPLVSPGWAQWTSSGLTGTVSDPSGQRVPGVNVTALQNSTGLQRKAISSADGAYYFPKLPVGTYTVTFDHQDFQSQRFENVVQKLEETRILYVALKVAGPQEQWRFRLPRNRSIRLATR